MPIFAISNSMILCNLAERKLDGAMKWWFSTSWNGGFGPEARSVCDVGSQQFLISVIRVYQW